MYDGEEKEEGEDGMSQRMSEKKEFTTLRFHCTFERQMWNPASDYCVILSAE
jgi:hypothetical protein